MVSILRSDGRNLLGLAAGQAAIGGPLFLAGTGLRAGGRETLLAAVVIGVTAFLASLAPLWFGQNTVTRGTPRSISRRSSAGSRLGNSASKPATSVAASAWSG